jgi:hypothetical protein
MEAGIWGLCANVLLMTADADSDLLPASQLLQTVLLPPTTMSTCSNVVYCIEARLERNEKERNEKERKKEGKTRARAEGVVAGAVNVIFHEIAKLPLLPTLVWGQISRLVRRTACNLLRTVRKCCKIATWGLGFPLFPETDRGV